MKNHYVRDDDLDICPIYVKRLFLYKNIDYIFNEFMPSLSYVCKGLVFYTLNNNFSNYCYVLPRDRQIRVQNSETVNNLFNEKYPELVSKNQDINITDTDDLKVGFDISSHTLQQTPPESGQQTLTHTGQQTTQQEGLHTTPHSHSTKIDEYNVVFRILKSDIPDIYQLYCYKDNKLFKLNNALVPNIKISKMLYFTFQNNKKIDMNMECSYSKHFKRWVPVKVVESKPFTLNKIKSIESKILSES